MTSRSNVISMTTRKTVGTPTHIPEIHCEQCEGAGRARFELIQGGKKTVDCPVCRGLGFVDYALAVMQAIRIEELESELIATGKLVPIRSYGRLQRELDAIAALRIGTFDFCA